MAASVSLIICAIRLSKSRILIFLDSSKGIAVGLMFFPSEGIAVGLMFFPSEGIAVGLMFFPSEGIAVGVMDAVSSGLLGEDSGA